MKKLTRGLSRVADSSQYSFLKDFTSRRIRESASSAPSMAVQKGHVPVYVGDEMARYVVSAEALNHPLFLDLLDRSAQEYGYEHEGPLRIHCNVFDFERVLQAIRRGCRCRHLDDLLSQFM